MTRPSHSTWNDRYAESGFLYGTGGPPTAELPVTLAARREELSGLDLVVAQETEREVHEGRLHTGTSAVVQVLGIRPGDGL